MQYTENERFTFRPLEKESQGEILPGLFAILHGNMDAIAPTGKGYEEDESLWCSCIGEALEKEPRKLLVIRDSYSNCLGTFLANNYAQVVLVDLRYYKEPLTELVAAEGFDDVLVCYSLGNFLTDANIIWLR